MSAPSIRLTDVTISYSPAVMGRSWLFDRLMGQRSEPFMSLRGVSLTLEHGESLGIIGNNGAGKTTTLKVMAGILPPTTGQVEINGNVTTLLDLGAGLEGNFNAWFNIDLFAELQRIPRNKRVDYKNYVVDFSELGDALSRPVRTYSMGMLLRLIFSLRTYVTPEILIVDEIFGVGDQRFTRKAQQRTLEILRSASSVAFSSHDFSLIRSFCTRTIWMEGGKIVQSGATDEVIANYAEFDVKASVNSS